MSTTEGGHDHDSLQLIATEDYSGGFSSAKDDAYDASNPEDTMDKLSGRVDVDHTTTTMDKGDSGSNAGSHAGEETFKGPSNDHETLEEVEDKIFHVQVSFTVSFDRHISLRQAYVQDKPDAQAGERLLSKPAHTGSRASEEEPSAEANDVLDTSSSIPDLTPLSQKAASHGHPDTADAEESNNNTLSIVPGVAESRPTSSEDPTSTLPEVSN